VRTPPSCTWERRIEELEKNICSARTVGLRTPASGECLPTSSGNRWSMFGFPCDPLGYPYNQNNSSWCACIYIYRFAGIEPRHNYKERLQMNTRLLPDYSNETEYKWQTQSRHIIERGKRKHCPLGHSYNSIMTGSGSPRSNNARNRPSHIRNSTSALQ